MQIRFLCFHTCKNENTEEYILQNAPFHSNKGVPQWLGQGYYLWTDSDHFAHEWGYLPPRNNKYAIIKFNFMLDNDKEFLDLVGNVDDQIAFKNLVDLYRNHLNDEIEKSKDKSKRKIAREQLSNLCVSTVIHFFQKRKVFTYKAVKAQDLDSNQTKSLAFVKRTEGKISSLFYPTRQQIVVYEHGRFALSNAVLHHIQ